MDGVEDHGMVKSNRRIRSLVALGLAIGLMAAACSSSSNNPLGNNPLGNNGGNGTGQSLSAGLAANLDKLDSYQFSWQFSANSSTASAVNTSSLMTSGTVVNKPAQAYKINDLGLIQIIAIGANGWTSMDTGNTWTVDNTYSTAGSSLKSLLPVSMYSSDFDTNATQFTNKGNESKNGVDCVHYQGNSSLGAAGGLAGVSATFKSDLWVAKNGNYPVSGFYGWTEASGAAAGTWGYSFDITHVNDAANNVVAAPTNITAVPS
jgi:hypothetical protein